MNEQEFIARKAAEQTAIEQKTLEFAAIGRIVGQNESMKSVIEQLQERVAQLEHELAEATSAKTPTEKKDAKPKR